MSLQAIDLDKLPLKCMGKFIELRRRDKHIWNGRMPTKADGIPRELFENNYNDLHPKNGRGRRPAPYLNHPSPHNLNNSQERIVNAGAVILVQDNGAVDDECLGMSSSTGSDENIGPGKLQPPTTHSNYRLKCDEVNADDYRKFKSSDDKSSDSSLEINVNHHHDEEAFVDLNVDHPPQQNLFKYLESDSEEDDYQLAECWPTDRRPITSLLSAPKELEVDGDDETGSRMNAEHQRHRTSSRRRMKNVRGVRLRTAYPPKLDVLKYEESRSESDFGSETNICDTSQEPESIFEDRELRRRAAASAGEWIRPIPIPPTFYYKSKQDQNLKGCSNQIEVPKKITPEDVDNAVLKLQSHITEEILHFGRELRMQIIKSEMKHRRSTRRACKFHYFLRQERVGNLLHMRYGFLRGRISEKVQGQVQQLEHHIVDKLTTASSTLRQLIENHSTRL